MFIRYHWYYSLYTIVLTTDHDFPDNASWNKSSQSKGGQFPHLLYCVSSQQKYCVIEWLSYNIVLPIANKIQTPPTTSCTSAGDLRRLQQLPIRRCKRSIRCHGHHGLVLPKPRQWFRPSSDRIQLELHWWFKLKGSENLADFNFLATAFYPQYRRDLKLHHRALIVGRRRPLDRQS